MLFKIREWVFLYVLVVDIKEILKLFNIQLPSAEDGEGFLWNIRIKNVSVVEQF